jgi:hypothetical protein
MIQLVLPLLGNQVRLDASRLNPVAVRIKNKKNLDRRKKQAHRPGGNSDI